MTSEGTVRLEGARPQSLGRIRARGLSTRPLSGYTIVPLLVTRSSRVSFAQQVVRPPPQRRPERVAPVVADIDQLEPSRPAEARAPSAELLSY